MAQEAGTTVGALPVRGHPLRDSIERLLLAPAPDRAAGWQLAMDLGRPAVPMLRGLLQRQGANVQHRLVVLAALLLAAGLGDDDVAFDYLGQQRQKPMLEERTLVAMMMALGPQRARPAPEFWTLCLGPTEPPEQLLAIAARLAAARFPGAAVAGPVAVGDDIGLLAATAFAGMALPVSALPRLGTVRCSERHASLFWRGWLLGLARRSRESPRSDQALELARDLVRLRSDNLLPAQFAAVWLRARVGDLTTGDPRLDLPLLRVAAGDPATAVRLQPWLPALPQPRADLPQRLAVAWALATPLETALAAQSSWRTVATIADHVATALALRACNDGASTELPPDGPASWQLLRHACGGTVDATAAADDAELATLLRLAAERRIGRPALRRALEEMLWRWGSHPGCSAYELERDLLRDLLLVGSNYGGAKYATYIPPDQRYGPTGLDRNDAFFRIAVDLFDFLARPRGPIPAEYRLPE